MAAVLVAPHPDPRPTLRLVPAPARRASPAGTSGSPGSAASVGSRPHRCPAATYRRRRLAVAALALVLLAGCWSVLTVWRSAPGDAAVLTTAAVPAAGAEPAPSVEPASGAAPAAVYVVRPGDTVWTIAERLRPGGDVRDLVDQLTERAGGSGLQAGQRIALDGLGL